VGQTRRLAHHPAGLCALCTITRSEKQTYNVAPEYFRESQEKALFEAVLVARQKVAANPTVEGLLASLLPAIPAINAFFDTVLVMDEDQASVETGWAAAIRSQPGCRNR
jgi:glycyl-tRNA synthetase beta subunit